ncbi:hypothetical protein [Nonomuraea sp. GTA35]|uniref:hypothetical protein n=1 Tax=Nonomuraea sp. GTA35 TaxID=1676746 RepID=UPI0035BFA18E
MRIHPLPLPPTWKRRLETAFLVMYSINLVCAAFVLATEHLYWMALGQLLVLWALLEYAHKARKSRTLPGGDR